MKKPLHVVVGCGKTGLAVVSHFQSRGEEFIICDDNPEKAKKYAEAAGIELPAPIYSFSEMTSLFASPKGFSKIVVSPGIAPHHPFLQWCRQFQAHITSELDMALSEMAAWRDDEKSTDGRPIFWGVTGTNGKTTTVELISHLLNSLECTAEVFGNIGRPLLEIITAEKSAKIPRVCVIELSSFQIERISTPLFNGCVWLNLTPDHLDWHLTMESYQAAKERLIHLLDTSKGSPWAVLHSSLPQVNIPQGVIHMKYGEEEAKGQILDAWHNYTCFGVRRTASEARLPLALQKESNPARHDIENFLAAATLVHSLGYSLDQIASAYESFEKGAHRIEYFCSIENVDFYDDSKGTNIHATIAAVEAIPVPIVLIAGGVHKGHPYAEWRKSFEHRIKAVVAIGQSKESIKAELEDLIPVYVEAEFEKAIQRAFELARYQTAGNHSRRVAVLLSPGCSSFDMFKDYKDRGEQFKRKVRQLAVEQKTHIEMENRSE